MNYKTFETERLILRPTGIEDAYLVLELLNMPKWIRFIGDRNVHTLEDAQKYIEERMLPQFFRLGYGNFTVIRKEDQVKIGTTGLYDREGLEGLDIGFAFLGAYEGNGYAYESSIELVKYAFSELDCKLLKGITDKKNIASQKLLEKLGLTFKQLMVLPGETDEIMLYQNEVI